MGRRKFGKHPLQRIALAKARPVSRETLRAIGWDESLGRTSGKPRVADARKARMALRGWVDSEQVGATTLITKTDLLREDEVRRESMRVRQAFAKARFEQIGSEFKKRLAKIVGRGKPSNPKHRK